MNGELRIYPALGYVVASLANLDPPAASNLARHLRQRLPEGPATDCRGDRASDAAAAARAMQRPPTSRLANINPAWSPDGRGLVFDSERDGAWHTYIADADGSNVRRVTTPEQRARRAGSFGLRAD